MPQPTATRLLLIDDDEMSRELLAALLEAEGYAVTTAESGAHALELLGQNDPPPAIILTDLQMPGMTPVQLADRLRLACGGGTALLAMSGTRPAEGTLQRFDGFLLKPFGMAEFQAAVDRIVAAKPGASPLDSASNTSMDVMRLEPLEAETHTTPLDEAIYQQLAKNIPQKQLGEMYSMCLEDTRMRIESMRNLAQSGDAEQFRRQAHAIKGSCGMLGAKELHGLAAKLEEGDTDAMPPDVNSLDELTAACDRLERMLRARA